MVKNRSFGFGVIVIIIGALLLMQNLGLGVAINFSIGVMFNLLWPLILVYFGFKRLKRGQNDLFSYLLIAMGIFFMMSSLGHIHPIFSAIRRYFLPLTIICIGLLLVFRAKTFSNNEYHYETREKFRDFEDGYTYHNANDGFFANNHDYDTTPLDTTFYEADQQSDKSNRKRQVAERTYNTTFNSNRIALNESDLIAGLNVINLNCTMGEIKISLPKTINILLDGQSTFGEIKFLNRKYGGINSTSKAKYTAPITATKTVHIKASAQFSEISITLH